MQRSDFAAMGQTVTGRTAGAACGGAVIDLGPEQSVLILLKHCRDMKRQETSLRLVTLLLLLSCAALFLFTVCAGLKQRGRPGSSGQASAVEQSPAYSKQDRVFPTDSPQTNIQRLNIHLRSLSAYNLTDGVYIRWDALAHKDYNIEKSAIVIPENGFYFVYVRIALSCHDEDGDFERFYVALHKWSESYNEILVLTEAWDSLVCTSDGFRSVFVGQLFDLSKGDHVSVWIGEGYKLIIKSSFGAYRT